MKLTKIFAGIAACAVSMSALAVTSFAALTNPNDGVNYVLNFDASVTDIPWNGGISGAVVTFTLADGWNETGVGGCVGFQGDGVDWGTGVKEFGMSGEGEDVKNIEGITVAAEGNTLTVTYDFGGAIFAETASWAQYVTQYYWGADITLDDIKYVDLNGDVIGAQEETTTTTAAEEEVTTTTTAAAEEETGDVTTTAAANDDTAATTTTAATGNTATGVEGVASVVALLTIAGAAVVITKKH